MKRKYFIIGCALVLLALPFFSFKESGVDCQSHEVFYHNDVTVDALYIFKMHDGKGTILMNGWASNGKIKEGVVREIHFTYDEFNDSYLLKNTYIVGFYGDTINSVIAEKHLPSFFYKKGAELALIIQKGLKGEYLISLNRTPVYYCKAI